MFLLHTVSTTFAANRRVDKRVNLMERHKPQGLVYVDILVQLRGLVSMPRRAILIQQSFDPHLFVKSQ